MQIYDIHAARSRQTSGADHGRERQEAGCSRTSPMDRVRRANSRLAKLRAANAIPTALTRPSLAVSAQKRRRDGTRQ
jgi:hypothetical protein